MWCRTILTAVAISCTFTREIIVHAHDQGPQRLVQIKDVICMLVWSGLQKEDLDASTLEKLGQHNVNIDDMNNEQWRQECSSTYALKENVTENHVTTAAFVASTTNEHIENDANVGTYPKIGMLAANFEDTTIVQNEVNINNTKRFFDQLPVIGQKMPPLAPVPKPTNEIIKKDDVIDKFNDLGNLTTVEENKGLIKMEYNIRNQPDLESVMNFWTKFTQHSTTVTKLPITPASLNTNTDKKVTSVQVETNNNGYVNSREMEYISRILAEYLASQTIPTTTKRVSATNLFMNYVPTKYGEISNKAPVEEEQNRLNEQSNEINKLNNVTRDDMRSNKIIYSTILEETKSMPFKVTYDSTQHIKTIQETPYSQILRYKPVVIESKPVKRNSSIRFLHSILQMKNELYNNGVLIPDIESTTETITLSTKKSNEQQDKSESFNQYNLFNYSSTKNYITNDDQPTSALKEAEIWKPALLSNSAINKEFEVLPILKKETNQVQKFDMYDAFKAASSNIIRAKLIQTYNDETTVTNKPEQMQYAMNMNERQAIPANIIKEIAEKVKLMVLKDIEKDVTTTTVGTPSSTTTAPTTASSTSMTTTITTSEKPSSTLQKEITQANSVVQKLMELFKELKAMKDTEKLTSQMSQNITPVSYSTTKLPQLTKQIYPQAIASLDPYLMKNHPIFKPIQTSFYDLRMVPVPTSSGLIPPQNKAAQNMPSLNSQQTNDYHSSAITIQTNSNEIAPLAIQISKPMNPMSQQIVVSTKSSADKHKEEQEKNSKKRIEDKFRNAIEARNHGDKLQSDYSKQVRFADSLNNHEFRDRYSYKSRFNKDRENSWYNHEYNETDHNIDNKYPDGSKFSVLNYPGRLNHLDRSGRISDLSNSDGSRHPGRFNRPSFNEPASHQNEMYDLKGNRHQSGPHGHQPRYEPTKFHEKLERIENWPRSTWKDFKALSTDNSYDEIPARQQMPMTKVKQRTRFDDTHFTNFLKSQQKVTDLLEKILANNVKNSPHSYETPIIL